MLGLSDIPEALREGENWEYLTLDPHWVWTVEDAGKMVGILIAGPCHGLVFIWRVKVVAGAPRWTLGKLFRNFIRDLRKRGCLGYMACLNLVDQPRELAIARIALRAGASITPTTAIVYGSVSAKHVGEK